MDLLGFLKEKREEKTKTLHPFAYSDNSFKYLYCLGLGVLACGHMKAIAETKELFEEILESIKLGRSDRDRIIIDINNNFDYKINEVFGILDTKEKQYTFTADLLKLSNTTLWAQSYCENVIEIYMSIFRFHSTERRFLSDFSNASEKCNVVAAGKIYNDFVKAGYYVEYALLKYICCNFLLEDNYDGLILQNGEVMNLDKPTTISGKVIIKNGSSLNITGADIKINGSILIDGGRLRIKKSKIMAVNSDEPRLIRIKNTAMVKIEDSVIDCNFKCGMLYQEMGYLIINDTKILHTKNERAVCFLGEALTMNGTDIEDGLDGGISILKESITNIDDCRFYHCEAEHGGAVYIDSLYDAVISNCIFKNCRAKYLGGAIYFAYKKYGQNVFNCEIYKCLPKNSSLFNCYKQENITEDERGDQKMH